MNQTGAPEDPLLDYFTGHAPVSAAEAAALLDALSATATDASAQAALRRARRALSQQGGGRPAINDQAALRDITDLLATGRARSFRRAAFMVARARYPFAQNHKSVIERFRRKWERKVK